MTLAERAVRICLPALTLFDITLGSMNTTQRTRRRKPRFRKRVACLLLGHRWQRTSLVGYASRCSRCRLLWRGVTLPAGLSQNEFPD